MPFPKGAPAARKPTRTVKSWSFTRYSDYNRCPAFFKYKYLDKLPTPKHPAMQRGADIADATEKWFKRERRTIPPELKPLESTYKALRKDPTVQAEAAWGFTRDWEPCGVKDWDRCFLRCKIDILTTSRDSTILNLYDSKTGKFSEHKVAEYQQQLKLYASAGTVMFPQAKKITTQLLFSDLGIKYPQEEPRVFTRAEAEAEIKEWEKKIKPMFADTQYAPRPNYSCRWCPFSRSKGGPCKY